MAHLRSPVVAIATCADVVGVDNDDLCVIASLRRRGIEAVHAVWDDPAVDWERFALVVIRSTWDYSERCDAFLFWASRLRKVLNPLPVLRWNTDKRYLANLSRAGYPVIPTRFLSPGDPFEPPSITFVVKPAVSCSSKNTARYRPGDGVQALDHVRHLQAAGRTVMIQPYFASVESAGEISLMFIGGIYSHSIRRRASLKHPGLWQETAAIPLSVEVYEDVQAYEPTSPERSLAERVMLHIAAGSSSLLYARVDLIAGPGGEPVILEVELTEPTLFLNRYSNDGVERLVNGIESALAAD
jgi:hypothetical protein